MTAALLASAIQAGLTVRAGPDGLVVGGPPEAKDAVRAWASGLGRGVADGRSPERRLIVAASVLAAGGKARLAEAVEAGRPYPGWEADLADCAEPLTGERLAAAVKKAFGAHGWRAAK